jgi:hypothetical protein
MPPRKSESNSKKIQRKECKTKKKTAKMALNAPISFLAFAVLRFFQLVMALTVCGLYAVGLHNTRVAGVSPDARWVCFLQLSCLTSHIDGDKGTG